MFAVVLKRECKCPKAQGELLLPSAEIAKHLPLSFAARQANGQCLSIQRLPIGKSASENSLEDSLRAITINTNSLLVHRAL